MTLMDMLEANEAAASAREGKGTSLAGNTDRRSIAPKGVPERNRRSSTMGAVEHAEEDAGEGSDGVDGGRGGGDRSEDSGGVSAGEDDSEDDSAEEEEDGDGQHVRLLDFVDSLGQKEAEAERAAEQRRTSQLLKEGEFNSTAATLADAERDGSSSKGGALTMKVTQTGLRLVLMNFLIRV